MPLDSARVGLASAPMAHEIDSRWTMAYAAALGDELPCYFDTTRADGVLAHPLFPVSLEWPLVLASRGPGDADDLPMHELVRGVHATHDLHLHRPIRAGERLTTSAIVVGIERRRPGAYQVLRLDTVDEAKSPVSTTWMGTLFRGVDVRGPDRPAGDAPALDLVAIERGVRERVLALSATAAHVYTECARIWNPIHTDLAFARAAGLPGLLLHGTASLAHAVSFAVREFTGGDPTRVKRVHARFAAAVPLPVELRLRASIEGDTIAFEVLLPDGRAAVRDGAIRLE